MARLSFEKKRAQEPVGHPAVVAVRVSAAGSASVGGAPVVAAPGERIQQAVLNHLKRLAISLGAPIRATIHDEDAGCVVPLEVSADGSSRTTGEPARVPAPETPVGTAGMPTGQFGPPPVMDVATPAFPPAHAVPAPVAPPAFVPAAPEPLPVPAPTPAFVPVEPEPPRAHTPARGFDAVAEAMFGDGPVTETVEGAELLTEPMTRINEAVRAGRIEAAAELADRTTTEATGVLGPRHPEVLHLRELRAYIAYLADDPARAFRLSLDLARLRRQALDPEAAYGNVRSAATAWRAVRDPEEGLRMGRDLIDLWTELGAEPGPAATDPGPLQSARARMTRLTERAARA
ncbi:hypothetical protein NX794_17020 [Streptomyces sp. LP11]|uniref:Tetratricopeptide repeat protein n=1 Tax=Streptomyces pyxinicus TaxID=2970331 RepID=A0ABT2B328_9ACTN|nr:hypothetical protein [Streptomyces sp. LP11]MCS0602902.1 hypothetical protein [Streptomyces sp. LP11]